MRNSLAVTATAMCLALPVSIFAQAGAGKPAPGITVTLTKSVDTKKAKVGDPVMAKTAGDFMIGDGTKVPSGSKLSGHVTEAKPHADGQDARLAVIFESLEPKGGQPIPMQLQVAGVANPASPGDMDGGMAPMPSSGGSAGSAAGGSGGASSAPSMPAQSMPSGGDMTNQAAAPVTGSTIKDIKLGSDAVLTSSKKDVNLMGGTVLTLTMAPTQQTQQPPAGE